VALVDLDRAPGGAEEVCVALASGRVDVLSLAGDRHEGWPVYLRDAVVSGPAAGDLDGDGFTDLAVGTASGELEVLGYTGAPLLRWGAAGIAWPAAVFADVTGDSTPELISSVKDRQLTAWGPDGDPVPGWPLAVGASASLTPLVCDMEEDGRPEVVAAGVDGWLQACEVGWGPETGPIVWGAYRGNSARTAHVPSTLLGAEPVSRDRALAAADLVIYPNPCREPAARIQYRLGFATTVTVTILDLQGQEVWTVERFSPEGADEIEWPTDGVASGLYLCKVEAREASGSTIVFRKIAVVK